ncbi:MAG: prephenate dehydrogenase [Phycisphaerae bacterium]|jgi:prephenate dehydrogenase
MAEQLDKLAIIGAGLIGGAIGREAMKAFPGIEVVFYSRNYTSALKAVELGVGTGATASLEHCVKGADLVVIASPVRTFKSIFLKLKPFVTPQMQITDAGSTKSIVSDWAEEILGKGVFLGSHPIAGSEKNGIEHSGLVNLKGAKCVITPRNNSDRQIELVRHFWQSLGMEVVLMDADKHDNMYAMLSHLPHAMAAALVQATPDDMIEFAGSGFKDTTRIAEGGSDVWTDIFVTNSENMLDGIDRIIENLQRLSFLIRNNYLEQLEQFFDETSRKRKKINK